MFRILRRKGKEEKIRKELKPSEPRAVQERFSPFGLTSRAVPVTITIDGNGLFDFEEIVKYSGGLVEFDNFKFYITRYSATTREIVLTPASSYCHMEERIAPGFEPLLKIKGED